MSIPARVVMHPAEPRRATAWGFLFSEIVVPAKAGTQLAGASYLVNGWIPAFAGMTNLDSRLRAE